MLETVLTHLHNWFPLKDGKCRGVFAVLDGEIEAGFLAEGQYYRIRGSAFSDGLHRYGEGGLREEVFDGEVWALGVPEAVVRMAEEIAAWREENPESDKVSESFGGYSYTRGTTAGAGGGWQGVFAARLAPYRRPYDD